MTTEIKDRISQLAEINRALLEDLDVSHQMVAKYSGERDSLMEQVEALTLENRRLKSTRTENDGISKSEPERLRAELTAAQLEIAKLNHQRTEMAQDLMESHRRADSAEQKLHALADQYIALEKEKSHFELQFHELNNAMEDIRYNLIHCCQSAGQEACLF